MTVHRVIGTEVEYGISVPGDPGANPMLTSTLLVNAYAQLSPSDRRTRWDYEEEQPLRDARGFDLSRGLADPSQLTDEDPGMANVVLTNGARLYVDHAHPEFSTPEVVTPLDAVRWERAGQAVMRDAARRVAATGGPQLLLYKNNVDNKGASYGTHENYLMARSTPFAEIVRHLTPFFVSRQVVCGSGRVGIGQDGRGHGFQLSQRADYMETEVGLETTLKRPIINTRDEPHADAERWRRLHVIIGDANLSEVSTYLKIGTTALVLAMIEAGSLSDDVTLLDPVPSVHAVSHDPGLGHMLQLADGRRMTALDLQEHYLTQARTHVARHGGGPDERSAAQTEDVLARWESVLTRLRRDPMECARELDWVAKLQLLEQYRDRDGLGWDHPQLHLIDLQYSDIRPEKGLHARLEARGRIERLTAETEVEEAMHHPPIETRAWFRGQCLERYADQIAAASWDAVVFDVPGDSSLHRVPTMDPYRGSRAHVGDLLDRCPDPASLLRELAV